MFFFVYTALAGSNITPEGFYPTRMASPKPRTVFFGTGYGGLGRLIALATGRPVG
jgi:hypothetical protein